ncbi:hypothetical protein [Nocardioides lijunqiniae]|uniref:hypothetical protein n=1 Tax=Nocardioides lijunqiniae TaxID=2760832 RepID=UPI0018786071|nr:hypothetical protein [Nocardioides lijunqiniae]
MTSALAPPTAVLWESLDVHVGRPLLRARAASRNMLVPHVMSHDSAALAHGLPILAAAPELVHITRFGVVGSRTKHGVKHHRAPHRPEELVEIDGIWTLDRARTAVDIAREHGLRHGLAACDSALRLGVSRADLWEAVAPMTCWPYVTLAREAVGLADHRADNVAESLTRLLVLELGVGPVEPQFGLRDGSRVAWCDVRVGRHVVEFDGRLKYRPATLGGVATVDPELVRWREKRRQDWICGFQLGMSRITWADVQPDRWEATKRRVLREYDATRARYGTSIADLAPYVISAA